MKEEQAIRGGWKASRVYSQRLVKKRYQSLVQHNKDWKEYYRREEDFSKRVFEISNTVPNVSLYDELSTYYDEIADAQGKLDKKLRRQDFWFYKLPRYIILALLLASIIGIFYQGCFNSTSKIVQKHSVSKHK